MRGYRCLNCGFKFMHPDERVVYRYPSSEELSWRAFCEETGRPGMINKSALEGLPRTVKVGLIEAYEEWRRKKLRKPEILIVQVCPSCGSDAIIEIELEES